MGLKKYRRSLDLLLASASFYKKGMPNRAALYLKKATESADMDETFDELDDMNETAKVRVEAKVRRQKALAAALARRQKVKADNGDDTPSDEDLEIDLEESEGDDEDLDIDLEEGADDDDEEEEVEEEEGSDDDGEEEEEEVDEAKLTARLRRSEANASKLSKKAKK